MKAGELVWDIYYREVVLLVKKHSNVKFECFFPKTGTFSTIYRKELRKLLPKEKFVDNY
jgi:hypothetical protein